ncbi:AadS family aminoglycoside 6-adenylyltransferase [Chryseobacterium lactis]|uniref:AadS family aminoglycoside 6-adenylyltransferase n=1 Tax=Chryseobacterium lactis TaxID=1241981 RepID=A0A3G6RLG8_CHRLC|nr:AadS family aminoglycoside 6-adenylyltransferase [Chryseobacterium lactis]AZA82314.1 AadS family aminoglycoside 6-adenylyltransferase [Chryseobacterium lactis]AZB02696.1 AadS family aminoglycoside 6-adenylyltransferase [Chryseobacterium lactis]PNW14012.1 AadS family aminoglycoside 6-adenylyltransferase [Chryseobacterium lactis]
MKIREEKLDQIIQWAENNPDVRVVLLTSSLVNPYAPVDDFSDLDVELVFENRKPYEEDNEWIRLFGEPISMIEEDDHVFEGKHAMKMVLYKDHVKVDFKLYQLSEFIPEIKEEILPDDWDVGYRVLIDKDDLTKEMKAPGYKSIMIQKPTEKKFEQLLNDFWWDTTYVAKCLKRGDIFYAKFMSENILRTDYLVPLIEWYIAGSHDWSNITTNKHGRLFKKYVSPELWTKIEATFSGSDIDENWTALFAFADLVHELGSSLAEQLKFTYPVKLENDVRNYLIEVQLLP